MARLSIEQLITTPSTPNYLLESAYDYTKWNLGKGMMKNSGAGAEDNWLAPIFKAIRPSEESTAFVTGFPFLFAKSLTELYLFTVENTTAAATRRVMLHTINRKTGAISWNGFITLTSPAATAHTVRDFKIDYKKEITGTVAVSGTALTGTSTLFLTNRVAVGARIGFGSTDPTQITTWYRISAIASDTGVTLATSAGTIAAGTAFVCEEFRPVMLTTNATTTNGGINYAKGVTPEDFTSGGTTIAAAVSTDNVKAVYWLKDAATQTNIVAAGMALDFAAMTATSLTAYVVDLVSAGNYKFYTYNIRAALTVATGASVNAWLLATGNNPFTGTGSQNANLCIATAGHGTGSGVKSLYMVTTTRVYRVPVTQIVSLSTTVFSSPSDNITEIPTGGAGTYTATGALTSIEYLTDSDRFIITTTGSFNYLTQYVASGTQFDLVWGRDQKNLEQSTKDIDSPVMVSTNAVAMVMNDYSGSNLVAFTKLSTTAGINAIYIIAANGHWDLANTMAYIISPEIATPNAAKFYRGLANAIKWVGDQQLGKPTEPFEIYARTANIRTDATSGWTLLNQLGDISGLAGASAIQFKFEFKTLGDTCIPARILGVNVEYEDNTTDSHWAISVAKSDLANKRFAFWFKTAYGSTVPNLRINLYDATTGGLLLTDTSAAPANGTWEKSTDGSNWVAYNTTDRGNNTTYIRYTPTSMADNINVAAYLVAA